MFVVTLTIPDFRNSKLHSQYLDLVETLFYGGWIFFKYLHYNIATVCMERFQWVRTLWHYGVHIGSSAYVRDRFRDL